MRIWQRRLGSCAALWVWIVCLVSGASAQDKYRKPFDGLARPLIDQGYTVGVFVAVIDGDDVHTFGYGTIAKDSSRAPDAKTVFSIGSVTKTFTALLLADLVECGHVRLDDPVRKFLPASVAVPRKGDREITLGDLASHTSGLPRMPANFKPADPENPYADYTVEQIYQCLSSYQLPRRPGEAYEYSNLGMGLLGHVLARHEKKSYEALVVERICKPLGMNDTTIHLSKEQASRCARGHDLECAPVPFWDTPSLGGAVALRSTGSDLVRCLKAYLGLSDTPLAPAMASCLSRRHAVAGLAGWSVGLSWLVCDKRDVAWHSGGTGGFFAFVGFDRTRKFGIVWLSNSALWQMDPLRERLTKILLGEPVAPLKLRKLAKVDPGILKRYVGEYRIKPGAVLKVSLHDGYLFMGSPGKPGASALWPVSETEFFFMESQDLTVSFVRDRQGNALRLILHEGEKQTPAEKIQ